MLNEMTPKIKAVQKMQDYIAAHQTEEINLTRQITALRTLLYPKKHCIREVIVMSVCKSALKEDYFYFLNYKFQNALLYQGMKNDEAMNYKSAEYPS